MAGRCIAIAIWSDRVGMDTAMTVSRETCVYRKHLAEKTCDPLANNEPEKKTHLWSTVHYILQKDMLDSVDLLQNTQTVLAVGNKQPCDL